MPKERKEVAAIVVPVEKDIVDKQDGPNARSGGNKIVPSAVFSPTSQEMTTMVRSDRSPDRMGGAKESKDRAEERKTKAERRRQLEEELEEGLEDTFPASDPPAATQPKKHTPASGKKD